MGKKVAVVIKDKDRSYEGLRSALGPLLENHVVTMFVLDHEPNVDEAYSDNMGFIDEMGGTRYSNVGANIEKHGFKPVKLEEVPAKLEENELVIPF